MDSFFIPDLHRIHMDHQENSQLFRTVPLDLVDNFMTVFNRLIIRYLRMNGSHTAAWSIIVDDQIMRPDDSIILFHKFRNLMVNRRIDRLSDQWCQSIFCNIHSGDKMVAHVLCNGGCNAKDNFEYRGVEDCLAATKVCGGDAKACRYGCFGFGSCVKACKFDAIHVIDGVAVVDKEKCTNCGACRAACPHHLIVEVPYKQKVFVNCSNKDKGPAVTKVCANSCIACGMCERTCKFDAIHVIGNVAVIDYSKCKNCTMCAKACPRNAIEPIPTAEEKEKFKAAQKAAAEKKAAAAKAAAEAPKAE